MNITVVGFGHFAGGVTSCLVEQGHFVDQTDEEPHLLRAGQLRAQDEEGYRAPNAWSRGITARTIDLVWIAYDSPLNGNGEPVIDEILQRVRRMHDVYSRSVPFVLSCQWPVGTFAKVEALCPGRTLIYVMENVRAGRAIRDFRDQNSIIVGGRGELPRVVRYTLQAFTQNIVFVTPESSEMAKHVTNAFMALQIAFINEIAELSTTVGANPDDVATALRSDARVSDNAPLKPGGPFGGGSLLRDLRVLDRLSMEHALHTPILDAIVPSNEVKR